MADGEATLAGAGSGAGSDSRSGSGDSGEPVLKKPRISASKSRGSDPPRGQHSAGEPGLGEGRAAAAVIQPGDQEPGEAAAPGEPANGLWITESSKHGSHGSNSEQTPEPAAEHELSGVIDNNSVRPNGFYSPNINDEDDDDCSSHASSSDWTPQPQIGSYRFIQQHIMRETDPRTILKDLLPETVLPPDLDDMTLWQIIINISEPPKRKKRKDINTLEDVVRLLNEGKKILVLTGAGVSVSCGIPDFRSRDGIYARLAVDFPNLPDPQAMFDIDYFRRDPRPFFKFAKEIYPGQFQPSLCHTFISMLDKKEKLLRNYTQNIDTLEQVAGVQKIIQCHGSFATASCLVCKHKVDCEAVREDIFRQVVPHCPKCPDIPFAIMKPDIVFFGENLPESFHRAMKQDKDAVDLLIVIGSSLKVRPVALIPSSVPHEVPQVLINREPLPHLNFDVELLGDCDVIVNELCHRLGGDFQQLCYNSSPLTEITEKPPPPPPVAPEHPDAETQSPELLDTEDSVTEKCDTVAEVPETTVRVQGSCSDPGLLTEPTDRDSTEAQSAAKGAKSGPEREDLRSASAKDSSPGPESSDSCQNAPTGTAGTSPNANHQTQEVMERLNTESEEESKHTSPSAEVRRRCWFSRIHRSPISKRLGACQFLFQAPNRYIFHGAEVYSCSEDETSSSGDSDSCCSRDVLEEDSEEEEPCAVQDSKQEEEVVKETVSEDKSTSSIHTDRTAPDLHSSTDS